MNWRVHIELWYIMWPGISLKYHISFLSDHCSAFAQCFAKWWNQICISVFDYIYTIYVYSHASVGIHLTIMHIYWTCAFYNVYVCAILFEQRSQILIRCALRVLYDLQLLLVPFCRDQILFPVHHGDCVVIFPWHHHACTTIVSLYFGTGSQFIQFSAYKK